MRNTTRLTDPELEIMLLIWSSHSQISTSDIKDGLKETRTVQWLQNYLIRLEEKGFIKCEKIGRLNHYSALISIDKYRTQETLSIVDKLYQNSPTKLFATLLQNSNLSYEQVDELQRLLEGDK